MERPLRAGKPRPKPAWDNTVHDLNIYRPTPEELERKHNQRAPNLDRPATAGMRLGRKTRAARKVDTIIGDWDDFKKRLASDAVVEPAKTREDVDDVVNEVDRSEENSNLIRVLIATTAELGEKLIKVEELVKEQKEGISTMNVEMDSLRSENKELRITLEAYRNDFAESNSNSADWKAKLARSIQDMEKDFGKLRAGLEGQSISDTFRALFSGGDVREHSEAKVVIPPTWGAAATAESPVQAIRDRNEIRNLFGPDSKSSQKEERTGGSLRQFAAAKPVNPYI